MLFQATNVYPSLTGALGNGTIDVNQDLVISFQVNGNSPLVAYQIFLYNNDSASSQVFSTGKLTDNCPFYGTDFEGNIQFFSHTITSAQLTGAGLTNGSEYKMVIQQWWGATDTESIKQSSASVFRTRTLPTLSISNLPSSIDTRMYEFEATYNQAQGDTINWVRWQIAFADDTDTPIYDTENIYGTGELKFIYDGLFTGIEYAVKCQIQTENGIEATTGWQSFSVSYEQSELGGAINTTCAKGRDAVLVEYPSIVFINGIASGSYSINEGILSLPSGSNIEWNEVGGFPMNFGSPWSFIWQGKMVTPNDTTFFEIQTGNGLVRGYLHDEIITVDVMGNQYQFTNILVNTLVTIVVTPTKVIGVLTRYSGGLYPTDTLYPSNTLYPLDDDIPTQYVEEHNVPAYQTSGTPITSLKIYGYQQCTFVDIRRGTISEELLQQIKDGTFEPVFDGNTYMLADFLSDLNAGNLRVATQIIGYAIYRRGENERLLKHITDLDITVTGVYDYSAKSQQGNYIYYMFPIGTETYALAPLLSEPFNPIWWNWSILECSLNNDGVYEVINEFTFKNNVTSGSISNNNEPNIAKNFTRYPTVQVTPQNYKSGSLSALIGAVGFDDNGVYEYRDSIQLRDAIFNLSNTNNTLFLKNRKGDLIQIAISGAIQMETADQYRSQAQTATIPWIEIASADDVSIIGHYE